MTMTNPTAPDAGHATISAAFRQAVDIVRTEIESIDNMTPAEKRIATPQNQAVWIALSLQEARLLAVSQHTAPTPARSHAAGTPGEGV